MTTPALAPKTRQAFEALLDEMRNSADRIDAVAIDEQQAAEGYQALLHSMHMVAENAIDGDPLKPTWLRMDSRARKIGNSPDAEYDNAIIAGNQQYRIRGNRGSVHYIGFCVYGTEGGRRIIANLADTDIEFDKDGNFELIVSTNKPSVPGQWIPIALDANQMQLRQYILNRNNEDEAICTIEILGQDNYISPAMSDDAMADKMGFLLLGYSFLTQLGELLFPEAKQSPNTMIAASGASLANFLPTPDNQYVYLWYEIAEEESLVITGNPPESRYWAVCLYNRWMECPEYMDRPMSLTKSDVSLQGNGEFKITIGSRRPADGSDWLDTRGHRQGHLMFRWMFTEVESLPAVKLVKNT